MNAKKAQIAKEYEKRNQTGWDMPIDPMPDGIKEGDKFTIAGVKNLPDGTIIYNCKPGEETVFTARKI